jgi:hypothetical protein
MKEVKLNLVQVHVEPRVIKSRVTWEIGECLYDCCDDECAQALGFATKEEYRRKMNSKKGYKEVVEMMG